MTDKVESGDQAVMLAQRLAAEFAVDADGRDRDRRLPRAEVESLSASGLLGASVPSRYGGANISVVDLTEVFRLLATADGSLAQIPHSHFVFLDALRLVGSEGQRARFFAEALAGKRFANAQSERSSRTISDDQTTLRRRADGTRVLHGDKYYCTGAVFADWLVVRATLPDEPVLTTGAARKAVVFVERDTDGITVEDDWDALGQRTTASGTVRLRDVEVTDDQVVPYWQLFTGPTTYGSRAQILHAAIDAGLARAALDLAVDLVAKARPWFEAGGDRAVDDPLLVQQAGELQITVRGAEALLRDAAETIDAAEADLDDAGTERASVATAIAKVACARAATEVASAVFELGGTRAAGPGASASRIWRDARTHTLHDPARWKIQHIGRWLLEGTPPPRHGLL